MGLDAPAEIDILGHAGYFIAGMNKQANVTIHGNVGWSVAENIMSGTVRVKGCASECAGASGHGGLLVIEEDASLRCGISMKGVEIVVEHFRDNVAPLLNGHGKAMVVVASVVTMMLALSSPDPVLDTRAPDITQAPAVQARNHAAAGNLPHKP